MRVIAHRVTSGIYPSNSIGSLLFLISNGITAVEIDVCKIGKQLLVVHPAEMSKHAGISSFPPLDEFLKICKSHDVEVFIDVKTKNNNDFIFFKSIKQIISDLGMGDHSIIISKFQEILFQFKNEIRTGYIVNEFLPQLLLVHNFLLIPLNSLLKTKTSALKWGQYIIATGVTISDIELLRNLNIYGIMTDSPIDIYQLLLKIPQNGDKNEFNRIGN
jgi:glycerophosphoryl diester phosphodiesterase